MSQKSVILINTASSPDSMADDLEFDLTATSKNISVQKVIFRFNFFKIFLGCCKFS